MAEFCLDCVNKYFVEEGEEVSEADVMFDFELCEGCGEWKKCVTVIRRKRLYKLEKRIRNLIGI